MVKRKQQGESISGYFRKVFSEHPEWLEQKSNEVVLARYREDHGLTADDPVEKRVKDAMANMKSQIRKKLAGAGSSAAAKGGRVGKSQASARGTGRMEALEEQIDDCLTMARTLDKEGLVDVIRLLRRARNAVVWKMGEPENGV